MDREETITRAVIYGLRADGDSEYFYVGTTKYNASDRLQDHLRSVQNGWHSNAKFVSHVDNIGADNIVADVLERPLMPYRWDREKWWIEHLLESGHRLVNRIHNDLAYEATTVPDVRESIKRLDKIIRNGPCPPSDHMLATVYALVWDYALFVHEKMAALYLSAND